MEGRRKQEEGRRQGEGFPSSDLSPSSWGSSGVVGAVIAAAGRSTRMGGPSTGSGQAIDKLFAPLAGRPLLAQTLSAFQRCPAVETIALVVAADNLDAGRDIVSRFSLDKVRAVCPGGRRRQDSVRSGLEALGPCRWVVVHDGARPLVTPDLIERGLEAAGETGAAIAAVPLTDTTKEADRDGLVLRTLDRDRIWAAQTPQVFRYDLLLKAHREITQDVTDDSAMVEALGAPVRLYPGSPSNIKVTTQDDLRLAEALLGIESPAGAS